MKPTHCNGGRFYRRRAGTYPDRRYSHWILWQRMVQRRFLLWTWWADKDAPFWLDDYGFERVVVE